MTKLVVKFVALPRFRDDVAHYVVTKRTLEGLKRNLANDPFVGDTIPGRTGLFEYRYRQDIVTYAVAADFQTIYLLTIRPHDIPGSKLPPDIDKWLGRLNKLLALWPIARGG